MPRNTFKGLPGLLADSLPDRFGNAIIHAWLASRGRTAASFHPVERLRYIGSRGMGALEFEPATLGPPTHTNVVDVAGLVDLANQILDERRGLGGAFSGRNDKQVIEDILRVGTSAGGARAKAIGLTQLHHAARTQRLVNAGASRTFIERGRADTATSKARNCARSTRLGSGLRSWPQSP